jgi:hypothetical protein
MVDRILLHHPDLHFGTLNARASLAVMLSENTEAQKRVATLLIW